jgi:hypothetical protein
MKKYFISIVLLSLLVTTLEIKAAPVKAFICMKSFDDKGGTRAVTIVQALDMFVVARLKKDYPCVEYFDTDGLRAILSWERQRQLLGSADETDLQNLGSALGSKYLIVLNAEVKNDQALITAIFMDNITAKTLSRSFQRAPYGDAAVDAAEEVANKLFDGLKTYEICPFKGNINIKIESTLKDKQTEEYSVYCNGIDGHYNKTTTINNYSENEWTLNKNSFNASTGNVKFNLSEELVVDEYNPCYECSPTKQGNRSYNEKTTTYASLQKLSNESESEGVNVDDARAYLTFLDDGTYTLKIKASSTQGEKKTIKEVTAQGVCNNSNDPPEKTTNKIDEGILEIFGPFTGTAQDKSLSHSETTTRTNPTSGEEETITYEFNLTRE